MWVEVWYGDEFQSICGEEYISLDTPLCDLQKMFPESLRVVINGDEM